jgi:hypothetical protein
MNYSKQRGITLIGWLFLLTPLAIVFYAGIRIAPIYLNYMRVAKSLDDVAKEYADSNVTAAQIRQSLEKRLDIDSVTYPTVQDITVKRDGQVWIVQAKYEDIAPMFANLSLLLAFDKSVQL